MKNVTPLRMLFAAREKHWGKVITAELVKNKPISKIYAKHCQHSGVKGRPRFPMLDQQIKILNAYMLMQPLKPGQIPTLKYPLAHIPSISPIILPYDTILHDKSRGDLWQCFLQKTHRQKHLEKDTTLEAGSPSDHRRGSS